MKRMIFHTFIIFRFWFKEEEKKFPEVLNIPFRFTYTIRVVIFFFCSGYAIAYCSGGPQ